jgi:beta-phosphoglucomutase
MRVRAIAFDFNGTLSQDEEVFCAVFQELFAKAGRPLSRERYFGGLVGHADADIVRAWLGDDCPHVDALLEERRRRYRERVADGSTVPAEARAAVRAAARRVPVAVVSGDFRGEIERVLDAAGLAGVVSVLVALEDVERTKPHPDPYLLALERLGGLQPQEIVAIEDTDVGVASAKAAGLRCVAVLGSLPAERLGEADEVVPRLDAPLVERLLG